MTHLGRDRLEDFSVHPFLAEFPLIEGVEFDELVTSIKYNGLRRPIVLTADKKVLVDGRNRLRACEAATCDPVFECLPARYTEAMILDYLADANIKTWHLTTGQRAFLALRYKEHYAAAAKEQQRAAGGAQWKAGSDQDEALPSLPTWVEAAAP
jgi:hypothetical protein